MQRLPPSMVQEVAEAARAFNSMVRGLRWFQLYVPHTVVERSLRPFGGIGGRPDPVKISTRPRYGSDGEGDGG